MRISIIHKGARRIVWTLSTWAVVGTLLVFGAWMAHKPPTNAGDALHHWQVPSFWFGPGVVVSFVVVLLIMLFVSHNRSTWKGGAVLGAVVVAAAAIAVKLFWPQDLNGMSAAVGTSCMLLVIFSLFAMFYGTKRAA